jgi:hypothetical protein
MAVVLPFRLFSISLLFRMSSKISDACTKAAGAVYIRALLQVGYAGLVLVGALVGQRWGVGGVAVAVSAAMAINWLAMAELSRSVTGLGWGRFGRAHAPAVMLALLVGLAAAAAAHGARAAGLGNLAVLLAAGLAAALAALIAGWMQPNFFLGPHGIWARTQGTDLLRGRSRRGASAGPADPDAVMASAGEPSSTP